VLRLFGFLVLALVGASGILFLDFNRAVQQASAADEPPPSFEAYLETVPKKLAALTRSARAGGTALSLAEMLPRVPEGWTMRPLEDGDIQSFLPRAGDAGDPAAAERVQAVGSLQVEDGATVAIQAYERGERRVVIQLIRLPDSIFRGLDAIERRHDLQVQAAELRGRPFMTVRGLDVTEEFLGEGMRARFFSASVGAQIQIRVLASRRSTDAELVPFFETLNVKAMNAAVVDRKAGLGELPVLVLGSALTEEDRAAYEADRAARAASAVLEAGALLAAAKEKRALTPDSGNDAGKAEPKPGITADCRTDAGGIKRCSVATGG
jgi:hypothetical protein